MGPGDYSMNLRGEKTGGGTRQDHEGWLSGHVHSQPLFSDLSRQANAQSGWGFQRSMGLAVPTGGVKGSSTAAPRRADS
jgi:hypothetical protein